MAHAKMRSVAVAIAVVTVTLVGAITPRGAQGATQRQAAVPTVNPGTFNYSLLALPSWALPAGAKTVDTQSLTGGYCVPDTSDGIVDEFLLVHRDWCEGLNATGGIFQDFFLDPGSPVPFVGEWATSVYIDSAHAQAVVQGIQSYLSSENDLNGTCSASPNCVLGIFDDVETIDNPDGTTSPSSTHTVHYAVWSQGNIVGEVAVSHAPDQADSTGASYADGMIKNGAVLLSELLAGQQPAAPTATPTQTATSTSTVVPTQTSLPTSTAIATSTPTRTATATPTVVPTQTSVPTSTATPTPTPTAMATAGRLSFSVLSVKLAYGSAKPGNGLHRASLGLVRPGQNVKLLMYVRYSGIQGTVPVRVGFRVLRAGRTAYFVSTRATSSSADNGGATAYWTMFRPKLSGAYTFNGTISVETKHKHKSVTFKVAQS